LSKPRIKFIEKVAELTRENPAFIHLDMIGLAKLSKDNESRLNDFSNLLGEIESAGGNICIPSYSLSYTRKEDYDMLHTPVINAGYVSEFVRQAYAEKRTVDALFSYIVLGNKTTKKHFEVSDYDSFGNGSLIDEVFELDGYVWTIGGVFKNSTEIHYIEKLLNVDYREDKVFSGNIIDIYGNSHRQSITFFCKNFDYRYWYDFKKVENDLRSDGLMEVIREDDFPLFISGIKFGKLYDFLKKKLSHDKKYICSELHFKKE